jgi:hypothetical protein
LPTDSLTNDGLGPDRRLLFGLSDRCVGKRLSLFSVLDRFVVIAGLGGTLRRLQLGFRGRPLVLQRAC